MLQNEKLHILYSSLYLWSGYKYREMESILHNELTDEV